MLNKSPFNSTGAITSFSKALAVEEAKNGVRVNIVSPGNIWTPMWAVRVACFKDLLLRSICVSRIAPRSYRTAAIPGRLSQR